MNKLVLISLLFVLAAAINAQEQPAATSAAERLAEAIDERGLEAALQMFAELREHPEGCDFSEQEFDALGDRLLNEQNTEAAVAVFGLNVEMFPESWNAYFSLAKAHIHAGDRENAENNLEIVLNMYPNLRLAEFVLADLDGQIERVAVERDRSHEPGGQTGLKGPYLGQKPPGLTAEMFAPGIVSKALALNFSCTFSPDGREFYFNHFMTIMVCRRLDEGWTAPEPVSFTGEYRAHEPHVTLDGTKLYFGWFRPTPEDFPKTTYDYGIYACERTAEGWSEPAYVGFGMFVTSSRDGTVYVTEKRFKDKKETYAHIKRATLENGVFAKLEPLGGGLADLEANFPRTAHPSISPDGRTILFDCSMRSGLYAAFLDESGVWSEPVTLSDHGLPASAGIASYSPDGEYVFFHNEGDIYWISSEFIERLRPFSRSTSQARQPTSRIQENIERMKERMGDSLLTTADEVIARHVDAVGGRAAILSIKTMLSVGKDTCFVSEDQRIYRYCKQPELLRISRAPKSDNYTLSDGGRIWYVTPEGRRELDAWWATSLSHYRIDGNFIDYENRGIAYEYVGLEGFESEPNVYYHLRRTFPDGFIEELYFDVETGLLHGVWPTSSPRKHDPLFYYDYRDVGGILVPHMWVRALDNVGPPHILVIEEVRVNEDFGEDFFTEYKEVSVQK